MDNVIECGGFTFVHNFDSGNLGQVEQIPKADIVPTANTVSNVLETPDYEFNVWTRPDCAGTEYENGNRTWFYFGIQGAPPLALVKLNIVNLNRQSKMYSQGMAPVTKTLPGKTNWERIKDRPTYFSLENIFTLSFKYRTPENKQATTYFAFTYPYTYTELQNALMAIDTRMMNTGVGTEDDIYYCRECACYSLERRRLDLITITSRHGITTVREERLKNLFPDQFTPRPYKFLNKKVIILSARVHPGETPSSFVLNGILNLLLSRHDPVAICLRRLYVFKFLPILNPDGVARGQYRTDTRGVNLNRVYLAPSLQLHPTIFAARSLIRYYHYGFEKEDDYDISENVIIPPTCEDCSSDFLLDKDFENPDQENLKFYQLSSKRKKTNLCKDLSHRWSNLSPFSLRPPLQTRSSGAGNTSLRSKVKVDSEDDTSSSLLITSPTLADQVEDLNLNQKSLDGFNPCSLDDECAVDHIIRPSAPGRKGEDTRPSAGTKLEEMRKLIAAPELTSDDDDSVMCGTHPLGDAPKLSTIITGEMSVSESLKFSQSWCVACVRTIKELEGRMPGISNMLPARYKDPSGISEQEAQHSQCVNCHAPLRSPPPSSTSQEHITLQVNKRNSTFLSTGRSRTKNSQDTQKKDSRKSTLPGRSATQDKESGLFLYMDMHGHASKKGVFVYGNHFPDSASSVECMLLPRIMSLNSAHFHFTSCNFTERNMYLRDRRDGMSREGSGRVAVLKATGLTRSYTLECNYNTGRIVNPLPQSLKDTSSPPCSQPLSPPKYTPALFEEVGRALGASFLDLTGQHPNSRIPNSEHRNLHGVREWLKSRQRDQRPTQVAAEVQTPASSSRSPRPASRKENLLAADPNLRPLSSSRLHSSKYSSTRSKVLSDTAFSSKSQRNLSLISIKKPVVAKHSAAFKAPLKNKSPSRRIRHCKSSEDADSAKPARSLMESTRINKQRTLKAELKVQKESAKTKSKPRAKEGGSAYQKQPAQVATKPAKRLKVSQFVKYSDSGKEKFRGRKGFGKAGVSTSLSSPEDSWDGSKDLPKIAAHKFL